MAATPGMMSHKSLAWHHPPAVAVVIQVWISRIQNVTLLRTPMAG
jgi:hypothetical protein